MAELNLIPQSDYIDACNAVREKDGSTGLILSGELGAKIREIPVGKPEQSKTLEITENGDFTVTPDVGKVLSEVIAKVNVPTGGGNIDALIDRSITEIRSSATSTGSYAFYDCDMLETVDLPSATSIGYHSFYKCKALTNIDSPVATYISTNAFNSCSALTTANFPAVTHIDSGAFNSCSALTTANFPAATHISESYSFYNCIALKTIDFPVLINIGVGTFRGCSALTTANFPAVTRIESAAFLDCNSLTTLILGSLTLCVASANPNINSKAFIYVPKALIEQYKAATNWSQYAAQFRAIEDYPDIVGGQI